MQPWSWGFWRRLSLYINTSKVMFYTSLHFIPVRVVFSPRLSISLPSHSYSHSLILTAVAGSYCVEIFSNVDFYWLELSTEVMLASYDHSCKRLCVLTCATGVCMLGKWSNVSSAKQMLSSIAAYFWLHQVYKILVSGALGGSWVIFRRYDDFYSLNKEVSSKWVKVLKWVMQQRDN